MLLFVSTLILNTQMCSVNNHVDGLYLSIQASYTMIYSVVLYVETCPKNVLYLTHYNTYPIILLYNINLFFEIQWQQINEYSSSIQSKLMRHMKRLIKSAESFLYFLKSVPLSQSISITISQKDIRVRCMSTETVQQWLLSNP